MQKILLVLMTVALCATAFTGCSTRTAADGSVHPDVVPEDSAETALHWEKARAYQQNMRLELARQEYLLALAACRTAQTRDRLQRELQIVELQIRTMR